MGTVNVGDIGRVWVKGKSCWLGVYLSGGGYAMMNPGADPYTDTNPTYDFTGISGDFKPMATCRYTGSSIKINTSGPFTHPPLSPTVPWGL